MFTLMAIILMAFLIRFAWAYGISAGDNFALSGGTSASSHLNTIISILNGTFSTTNSALNYPIGSLNVYPPLMDFILAGVAGIVSLFGVSTATAAAGTLAWSTPILAALTCYPVYLVAKKMFGNDEKIGLLAALLYAFFALLIMTSVFSNGTEYAFIGFFFAWMVYFLLRAMEDVDKSRELGIKALISNRSLLKNTLIAGFLFLLIALSWNQFRVLVTCLIVIMILQALIDRFRSKEVSLTIGVYSIVILMGVLISAPYYISAGLWGPVFSGIMVVTVLCVGMMVIFALTSKKPWIIMIPVIVVSTLVIVVAMYLWAYDLYSALIHGNNLYQGELMQALMTGSHTSISNMAAYYGWLTLWLPILVFLWMLYRYPKNFDSRKYAFTMMFIISMFCIGWYSVSYAVIAGIGFAVASSMAIVSAIRWAKLRSYFAEMKGGDFKSKLKKIGKPVPLATVILAVVLILAPNILYAVDAATPTNSENDSDYFGGLGYTISTTDSSSMNKLWAEYSDEEKTGALVTWLSYSNDSAFKGGFDSVTDTLGGGTSAMANIILANGSSGATAAMAVRLMLAENIEDYKAAIIAAGLSYEVIAGYINDPQTAVDMVTSDIETYPGFDSSITQENALYVVLVVYITSKLCEPDVDNFYDEVCTISENDITYVAVNGSMLPIYSGDSSYFSTIAYFNSYLTDSGGAATQFFSYSSTTYYATYTDAMYETFLWKSLIGPSASYYGYSSTVSYLNALALSDGTVKAIPGYGLCNYTVAYWTVMYNADDDATLSSDGWVEMDGYEAIALQNEQGGMINYLAGVVLMEYSENATEDVSGTIEYTTSTGTSAAAGVEVAVYTLTDYDSSGVVTYVPTCVVKTLADGSYTISVPTDADYYITISSGATTTTGGTVIQTFTNVSSISDPYVISSTNVSGTIVVYTNDDDDDTITYEAYTQTLYVKIEGQTSGYTAQCITSDGTFSFSAMMPDVYTFTIYTASGTTVTTQEVDVCMGDTVGLLIDATSGTITVTVTDEYGNSVDSGQIVATNTSTGYQFTADIENGTAVLKVVPATYTLSATDGKAMASVSSSITVTSGGSKTSSVTVYDSREITVSGVPSGTSITLMSLGFITSSSTSTTFDVPISGGITGQSYTAYAVVDGVVYYGYTTGTSITMTSVTGYTITGNVEDSGGDSVSGATVAYILSSGGYFIFTTDADGNYTAVLPAGSYAVYSYDADGSAYLGSYTVSANSTKDIDMTSSRTITATLRYYTQLTSSGTKGIPFVDVSFETTIGGNTYTIETMTNSSGKAYFYVPTGYAVTASIDAFDTDEFYCTAQTEEFTAGSTDDSVTWSLKADSEDNEDMYVKLVSVYSEYQITLTLYTDSSVTYTFTGSKDILVGRYTATINGSTGYYYSGSVYVYPGNTGALDIDGVEVITVTLDASTNDSISVIAIEDDDGNTGSYYVDSSSSLKYYVEKGYSYYFAAKSASTGVETIAYGSVTDASSNVTLDLSDKAEAVTIKGYVGVNADGTVTMTYGDVSVPFDVTSGEFKIVVPKGQAMTLTAEVSQTNADYDNITYTYTSTRTLTSDAVVDGTVVNMASTTTSTEEDTVLSGSNCSFSGGVGSFVLSIENKNDYANTYIITSGSAWVLYKTYVLTVAANSTGTITISGFYDAQHVGAGNENLSVTVTDVSGNDIGSYVLDGTGFSGTSSTTYVNVTGADGASNDAVSTYEYLYAITIVNNDCYLKTAVITVTTDSIWSAVISDVNQYVILESGGSFSIKGYASTTIYVKVMCKDGSSTDVPDVQISVTMSGQTLGTESTGTVTISGSTATATLSPQEVDLDSSDMSASGDNIYNSPSTVPVLFWVLLALCVLGLIFIVWTGSKRGVFSRKK